MNDARRSELGFRPPMTPPPPPPPVIPVIITIEKFPRRKTRRDATGEKVQAKWCSKAYRFGTPAAHCSSGDSQNAHCYVSGPDQPIWGPHLEEHTCCVLLCCDCYAAMLTLAAKFERLQRWTMLVEDRSLRLALQARGRLFRAELHFREGIAQYEGLA